MGTLATHIYELAKIVGAVKEEGSFESVTGTTGVDTVGLAGYGDDDDLNGFTLYVWSGTGVGQERRITDFATSTKTVTVPTWTTNPTSASYIILHPNWRVSDLRLAIRLAIREEREHYLLPKVDTSLTLDFDATPVYAYTVPTGFQTIKDIWVERNQGDADYLDPVPPDAWYINRGSTKQIVFEKEAEERLRFMRDAHTIKIVGQEYETEPSADSDSLTIPMGVLMFLAASIAMNNARARDVNNSRGYAQLGSIFYQQWLNMRGNDWTVATPGSRWVNKA